MFKRNSRISLVCRAVLQEFWRGISAPHASILGVGALVFVLSLAGLEYVCRSGLFAHVPLTYLMKDEKDLFMYTSHTLASLRRTPPSGLQVYSIGGSSMAYAFKPSEFDPMIKKTFGSDADFYNFASGMQPISESIAIIEQLPPRSGLVLMGVNPRILSRELSDDRERWRQHHLLLHSPRRAELLKQKGFMDQFLFPHAIWRLKHQLWVHREAVLALRLPRHEFEASWFDRPPHTPNKKNWKIEKYAERNQKHFDSRIEANLDALRVLVNLCREKRLGLVLVELPLNPVAARAMGDSFMRHYRQTLVGFARDAEVAYWEYPSLKLAKDDFYDANHVMKSARLKIEHDTLLRLRGCERVPVYRLPSTDPNSDKNSPLPPNVDCHFGQVG